MYYRDAIQQGPHFCDTMYGCYKATLSYGLRLGGGIGYLFNNTVDERWALDVSFFFIVNVGMLNLVAGVIITTFGQLREEQARIKEDTEGVCFICGIDRQVFDRASTEPEGFKTHIKVDHNMWNYLYFIFMLWEQDKDDDDGLEQYVRRAIEANEITWFPLRKAMRLDQVISPADLLRGDLKESIKLTQGQLSEKFMEFQGDVNVMFDQLIATLKNEPVRSTDTANPFPGDLNGGRSVDDDTSLGASTQFGDSSYVQSLNPGKHVSVAMVSLEGVRLSESDLRTVSCRVISDTGVIEDYRSTGLHHGAVMFDDKKEIPLFDNVVSVDRRKFQLQILYGVGVKKFIGTLEMSVLELLNPLHEHFVIEKRFNRPEQTEACVLTISIRNEVATKYGRESPDMNDDVPTETID